MKGTSIRRQLDNLGFETGSVSEAILSTLNPDGSSNASPMGVIRLGPEALEVRPFKTSTAYRNLLRHPRACINITNDPSKFLAAAFKEERFDAFPEASFKEGLRLASSDAHVFIDVLSGRDISDIRYAFNCNATSVEVRRPFPIVFSRGRAEAIEAIVHATRIEVFMREGRRDDVERLIKRFHACKDVVGRVSALDSKEAMVIKELEGLIAGWRGREWR
jgi:hypothetical protein